MKRESPLSKFPECKQMINKACFFSNVFFCGIFQTALFACASIHQGYNWLSDESRGRQEIFCYYFFAAALMCHFS